MSKSITTSKPPVSRLILLLAGSLLVCTLAAQAADGVRYEAKPLTCKVKIEGTSTLHDWAMDGSVITGFLLLPPGISLDPAQAAPPGVKGKVDLTVNASIPVRTVKSGHPKMDEVYLQAMNAPEHPRILYHLGELTFKEPHAAGTPLEFDSKGDLVVNGVTNKITMPVKIEAPEKTKLKISGTIPLKMSAFKVKAPTLIGLVTTGDDIKISFEWLVAPK